MKKYIREINDLSQLNNIQALSGLYYITVGKHMHVTNSLSSECTYILDVYNVGKFSVCELEFSETDMQKSDITNSKLKELEKYGFYIKFISNKTVIKSWEDLDGIYSQDKKYGIRVEHTSSSSKSCGIELNIPIITVYYGVSDTPVHLPFVQIVPIREDRNATINLLKHLGFDVELSVDFLTDDLFKIKGE